MSFGARRLVRPGRAWRALLAIVCTCCCLGALPADAASDSAGGAVPGGGGLASLVGRLSSLGAEMEARQHTLSVLEELRTGILSGERTSIPSAFRDHLEGASPAMGEVFYDARHKPLSNNATRHFQPLRSVARDLPVRLHTFMPLKRASTAGPRTSGPTALLLAIDEQSRLSIFDPEAAEASSPLVGPLDLGHGAGRVVTRLVTTSSQESHYFATADDGQTVRVHSVRVLLRRENRTASAEGGATGRSGGAPAVHLNVTMNFTGELVLPAELAGPGGEPASVTAVLPVERGDKTYFAVGDSLGGISVFHRNGTLKGRARVTDDPGGVRGLDKGQSHSVLFFSSHSFGFFSIGQVDVQSQPCTGWNSPVVDVIMDPGFQTQRVALALADGDVIIFSTMRGKSKACDLSFKFPRVSVLPLKLQVFRGHIMGVPSLPEASKTDAGERLREVFFFNVAAMENGYGAAPSHAVTAQTSFKPLQPEALAMTPSPGGDRTKALVAIRFAGQAGIELYTLNLKLPSTVQAEVPVVEAQLDDPSEDAGWWGGLLGWFPKIGVFGVVLVVVILWNIRKAYSGSSDEFDEEFIQEQLRRARAAEQSQKRRGGAGVL